MRRRVEIKVIWVWQPFLWQLKTMKDKTYACIKEVDFKTTRSLFQALITAPFDDVIQILEDLKHPRWHVLQGMGSNKGNSTIIPTVLQMVDTAMKFTVDCLLDSGATGCYMDESLARELGLNLKKLAHPIPVYNVDRTPNEGGPIWFVISLRLKIRDHVETITFAITNTGPNKIILRHSWLWRHNPNVDWIHAEILFDCCPWEWGAEEDEYIKELKAKPPIPDRYIKDFSPIFKKSSFDTLPPQWKWDHAIELKDDSTPFTSKIYPLAWDEQCQLDKFIEEHLQSGRIWPSKSPIVSPFFFVKKKDGSLCPVKDYCWLNAKTIKNWYPLPLISEIIDKLQDEHYFMKFNVRWGYNNVRITEGDEWKAAFITNCGLFELLVMFSWLTNSPATFQTMMNELFSGLITWGVVIVYMDNILIFTKMLEEHHAITKEVLQILTDNGLSLKPEKCEWEKTRVEYLGVVVSEKGVEMDAGKMEAVHAWPEPKINMIFNNFLDLQTTIDVLSAISHQ